MACLSCTIELEPRTLSQGELNNAREAAIDLVSKLEPQKASNALIEGHGPVVPLNRIEEMLKKSEEIHNITENKESAQATGRLCECSGTSTSIGESPEAEKLREPLSAPF